MPNYEYRCSQCSSVQEGVRRVPERDAPMRCSQCGHLCERIVFPGTADVRRLNGAEHDHSTTPTDRQRRSTLIVENSFIENCGGAAIDAGQNVDLKLKNVKMKGNAGGGVVRRPRK
jgi:putative FmdB family regulatory protein